MARGEGDSATSSQDPKRLPAKTSNAMSIVTDNPELSTEPTQYDDFIDQRLQRTSFHLKTLDLVAGLILLGLFVLGSLLAIVLVDHWLWPLSVPARFMAMFVLPGMGLFIAIKYLLLPLSRSINPEFAALTVEQAHPELKNGLINFLFFRDRPSLLRNGVFQGMQEQAAADLVNIPIDSALDRSSIIKLGYALVALATVWVGYILLSPKNPLQSVERILLPWREIARPSQVEIQEVSPGNMEVYRGQTVDITAKIFGLAADDSPVLLFSTLDGQLADQRIPLSDDGIANRFIGKLTMGEGGIQQDLEYRIRAGDALSRRFKIRVLDVPHIHVERLQLAYPAYTEQVGEIVSGEGDIRAIEGTQVTVIGSANQEIGQGQIVFAPSADSAPPRRAALKVSPSDSTKASFQFPLRMNSDRSTSLYRSYHLEFTNAAGKSSADPIHHAIEVVPDRRPIVEILTPDRRTLEVPENGSQKIEVRALDPDFKLTRVQLAARTRGRNLFRHNLLESTRATEWHDGQFVGTFRFVPREFGLKEGDVVEYLAVAEDNRHGLSQAKLDPNRTISAKQFLRIVKADPLEKQPSKDDGKSTDPQADSTSDPQSTETPPRSDESQNGKQNSGDPNAEKDPNQTGKGEQNQPQEQQPSQDSGGEQSEQQPGESGESGTNEPGLEQDSNSSGQAEQQSGGGGKPGESNDANDPGAESSTQNSGGDRPSTGSEESSSQPTGDGGSDEAGEPNEDAGQNPSNGQSGRSSEEYNRNAAEDEPLPSSGERDGEVVERIRQHLKEKGSWKIISGSRRIRRKTTTMPNPRQTLDRQNKKLALKILGPAIPIQALTLRRTQSPRQNLMPNPMPRPTVKSSRMMVLAASKMKADRRASPRAPIRVRIRHVAHPMSLDRSLVVRTVSKQNKARTVTQTLGIKGRQVPRIDRNPATQHRASKSQILQANRNRANLRRGKTEGKRRVTMQPCPIRPLHLMPNPTRNPRISRAMKASLPMGVLQMTPRIETDPTRRMKLSPPTMKTHLRRTANETLSRAIRALNPTRTLTLRPAIPMTMPQGNHKAPVPTRLPRVLSGEIPVGVVSSRDPSRLSRNLEVRNFPPAKGTPQKVKPEINRTHQQVTQPIWNTLAGDRSCTGIPERPKAASGSRVARQVGVEARRCRQVSQKMGQHEAEGKKLRASIAKT